MLTLIAFLSIMVTNAVVSAENLLRRSEPLPSRGKHKSDRTRNDKVNQRILNSVAKQISTDLNGPRGTQHALCASGPLLVLSRFADLLVSAKLGFTPPLHIR